MHNDVFPVDVSFRGGLVAAGKVGKSIGRSETDLGPWRSFAIGAVAGNTRGLEDLFAALQVDCRRALGLRSRRRGHNSEAQGE